MRTNGSLCMNNRYLVLLLSMLIFSTQSFSKDLEADQQLARSSSADAVNRFFVEFTKESVCSFAPIFDFRHDHWEYVADNKTIPSDQVHRFLPYIAKLISSAARPDSCFYYYSEGRGLSNSDPFLTAVLIALMEDDTTDLALTRLARTTDRKLLQKFDDILREKLLDGKSIDQAELSHLKLELLTHLDLERNEKRSLLSDAELPRVIKAKLGHNESLDTLISKFQTASSFYIKKKYLDSLTMVGNQEAIEAIVAALDEIDFHSSRYLEETSFPYVVITQSLVFLYPQEKLFGTRCTQLYRKFDLNYQDKFLPYNEHYQYIAEVIKWAQKSNGVDLKRLKDLPFLYRTTLDIPEH